MDQFYKELIVSRIISGKIRLKTLVGNYIYKNPSLDDYYVVNDYSSEIKTQALSLEMLPEAEFFIWLETNKLWTKKNQNDLEKLLKDLDDAKVSLYDNFYSTKHRKSIKGKIEEIKKEIGLLLIKKHKYDENNLNVYIKNSKNKILFALGLYDKNEKKLFSSIKQYLNSEKYNVVDSCYNEYIFSKIYESDFREIARTDPWRTIWSCRESDGLFGVPSILYTEEQKNLVVCSSMYDNIYKHSDCPLDEIIADDDALDGWMILEKRKSKEKEKEITIDQLIKDDKIKNSSQIFIMSDGSKENLEFINSLNDPQALKIKKEKFDYLAKAGQVEEQDMPDSKRKIREIYYEQQKPNKR